jgi:hypothetical protein
MSGLFDDIFSGENGIAKTLIDLAEKKVSYLRYVAGTYDPITGSDTGSYNTSITISATPFSKYKLQEIDDSNILKGDLYTYVSPTEITWEPNFNQDKIVSGGITYYIINYTNADTGSASAAYKLQLRRAS